jgi:hypothetical protein
MLTERYRQVSLELCRILRKPARQRRQARLSLLVSPFALPIMQRDQGKTLISDWKRSQTGPRNQPQKSRFRCEDSVQRRRPAPESHGCIDEKLHMRCAAIGIKRSSQRLSWDIEIDPFSACILSDRRLHGPESKQG